MLTWFEYTDGDGDKTVISVIDKRAVSVMIHLQKMFNLCIMKRVCKLICRWETGVACKEMSEQLLFLAA